MKHTLQRLALTALLIIASVAHAERPNYGNNPQAQAFINEMVAKHDFDAGELKKLFSQAKRRQDIIDLMTRPAEGKPWYAYRKIFLNDRRIRQGARFMASHRDILQAAEKRYGVPPEIITAIIGVETHYGAHTGKHRVIDALSTLAFDYPKRASFFRKELQHFLLLTREEHIDPLDTQGSYAGAVGLGQFIPSSYRHYAVDGDGDGHRDLWHSEADAIHSVANYFAEHGWKRGQAIAVQAHRSNKTQSIQADKNLKPSHRANELPQLGLSPNSALNKQARFTLLVLDSAKNPPEKQYWLGLHNFYVITRYNHSHKYAMAVYQLSQAIAAHAQAAQ